MPSEALLKLRRYLHQYDIAAYIVPSSDPHQSEYLPGHWKTREHISGFTGSAGTLVVTAKAAGLWTDSRYFLQAEQELQGTDITLQKMTPGKTGEYLDWLKAHLPTGSTIGLDGKLFSYMQWQVIEKRLGEAGMEIDSNCDPVNHVWKDRPDLPRQPIFDFPESFAGQSRTEKLSIIRQQMQSDFLLLAALDDIAWTFNLRGSDIDHNPVFLSYALIGRSEAWLFAAIEKMSPPLRNQLTESGIQLQPYEAFDSFLGGLPDAATVSFDPQSTSIHLANHIPSEFQKREPAITQKLKAQKNPIETAHLRRTMALDGAALVRTMVWLEQQLVTGTADEKQIADRLITERSKHPDYRDESFPAIVGYSANGAIVHYRPPDQAAAVIGRKSLLLIDSGGQYLSGTTDITRTFCPGKPTKSQRRDYTLVLKGHIALAMTAFRKGTAGGQLDVLARQHLWQEGLNYGHGTGHGVGFFLPVHEPPQNISANLAGRATTPLQPGMLTSNEPGLYRPGQYGIRLENLILCVEKDQTEFGQFLGFETLTLFPFEPALILRSLLTAVERRWLNTYHAEVLEKLRPYLNAAELSWLEWRCAPI